MSIRVLEANPDLIQLCNEGYSIRIVGEDKLIIEDVPYRIHNRQVLQGRLIKPLTPNPDGRCNANDHTIFFDGQMPFHAHGAPFTHGPISVDYNYPNNHGDEIQSQMRFSWRPTRKKRKVQFRDLHHLVTTYVGFLLGPAQDIEPDSTAQTGKPFVDEAGETPFHYYDTASTRVGVRAIAQKLDGHKLAIVGLGGTGSYILDLVAKNRVAEIHLFDGDRFETHTAFRAPGAASVDVLHERPMKVDYYYSIYSNMKRGIHPHPTFVDQGNVDELAGMDFVFLAIDEPEAKPPIMKFLRGQGIPFVDVGLGITEHEGELDGSATITRVFGPDADSAQALIATSKPDGNDEYATNIQVAEANALNATLAVFEWKKHMGFWVGEPVVQRLIAPFKGPAILPVPEP